MRLTRLDGYLAVLCIFFPWLPDVASVNPKLVVITLWAMRFPWPLSLGAVFVVGCLSDSVISLAMGYPIFGSWTLFTYSGYLMMIYLAKKPLLSNDAVEFVLKSVGVSLVYWLWTNFGTWFVSGLYPHSYTGVLACYLAAIPFLKSSLVAALIWSIGLAAVLPSTHTTLPNLRRSHA